MLRQFLHISCLIALCLVCITASQGAETLQILEDEGKLVLTGEISKALGTYDEHLKGRCRIPALRTARQRVRKYYRRQ